MNNKIKRIVELEEQQTRIDRELQELRSKLHSDNEIRVTYLRAGNHLTNLLENYHVVSSIDICKHPDLTIGIVTEGYTAADDTNVRLHIQLNFYAKEEKDLLNATVELKMGKNEGWLTEYVSYAMMRDLYSFIMEMESNMFTPESE